MFYNVIDISYQQSRLEKIINIVIIAGTFTEHFLNVLILLV